MGSSGVDTRLRPLPAKLVSRSFLVLPAGTSARAVVAVCVLGVALASTVRSGAHADHRLRADRDVYAHMEPSQRNTLYITNLGLVADPFAWYASFVGRGDRLYYQVMPSGLGHFIDLPTAVQDVGRYALLPAKSVTRRSDANVIVSWNEDPGLLHIPFVSQERLGLQPYFVSRVAP